MQYVNPCKLLAVPLFPPNVSWMAFTGNVASLWYPGLYDTGLFAGFFLTALLLLLGASMKRGTLERVFTWPVIAAGAIAAWALGYALEIHQTLASGMPHMPRL